MFFAKRDSELLPKGGSAGFAFFAFLVAGLACYPAATAAQQPGQRTFSSAEDASKALVEALKNKFTELYGL